MPRKARQKDPAAVYHIMCRSNSELLLFRDNGDKDYFLRLIKRYLDKYHCSLYGYCLMDNHLHLHLDPKGYDVSKFMHCLNTAYVWYYNNKYTRHGHLFQDRFVSRMLLTDVHNLVVSAYIHNNPHDIKGYSGKEEMYEYSSYGIYLGISDDHYGIVDTSSIRSLFNLSDESKFADCYYSFVKGRREIAEKGKVFDSEETAFLFPLSVDYEYVSGRNVILRDKPIASVISFISEMFQMNQYTSLQTKCRQKLTSYRAITAYALRVLCNLSYKDICRHLYNITITSCSRLCKKGYDLIHSSSLYMQIFNELITNSVRTPRMLTVSPHSG